VPAASIFEARGSLIALACLAALTLTALLAVRTVIVGGEVAGWDHSFHYTNAYLTYTYFLPRGLLLGYDPWHMYGWSPNMYYNPGTTFFVAFTHMLTSRFLDMKSTYSLCVALSYALMAPAMYILVYALTKSRLAALVSAFTSITVFDQENSWTDVGWRQVYYIGMWPQRWGLVTGFASLGLFIAAMQDGRPTVSRLALAGYSALLLAWATLSHTMMGAATLLLMLLATVFGVARDLAKGGVGQALKRSAVLAAALCMAVGLLAFWAVPLLETNETFHGLHTLTWELGIGVIGTVLSSYPVYLNILIPVGPLIALAKRREQLLTAWFLYCAWLMLNILFLAAWAFQLGHIMGTISVLAVATAVLLYAVTGVGFDKLLTAASIVLLLWLATGPQTYVLSMPGFTIDLRKLPLVEWLGYGKFAGYARYMLLAYFSIVSSEALRWAGMKMGEGRSNDPQQIAAISLLLLVLAGFLWPAAQGLVANTDLAYTGGGKRFRFIEEFPLYRDVERFIEALRGMGLDDNTYILVQDLSDNFADWSTFCHNHFVYELPLYIGKPIVGGIVWTRYVTQPISTTEYSRLFTVENSYWASNPDLLYAQMRSLGITYIAVFDGQLKEELSRSGLYEELYNSSLYSVFRTREFNPIIDTLENGSAIEDVVIEPGYLRFTLHASPGNMCTVRIRLVAFPDWVISASPEPLFMGKGTFKPYIVPRVSQAWGYDVGSRIPFFELTLVPSSEYTVVEMRYEPRRAGEPISMTTIAAVSLLASAHAAAHLRRRARAGEAE